MKSQENLKKKAISKPNQDSMMITGGGGSYEIKVAGHLDEYWSERLGGLVITHDDQGCTLMTGMISDQAALHGILVQLRELGLTLIWLKPANLDG
jgi:hypothetical protein